MQCLLALLHSCWGREPGAGRKGVLRKCGSYVVVLLGAWSMLSRHFVRVGGEGIHSSVCGKPRLVGVLLARVIWVFFGDGVQA